MLCGVLLGAPASVGAAPRVDSAAVSSKHAQTLLMPGDSVVMARPALLASTEPDHAQKSWYGGQTLLSDALGLVLFVAGVGVQSGVLGLAGAGLLFWGAPVIHAVHQNWIGLGVSLGLRLATTLGVWWGIEILADSEGATRVAGFALSLGSVIAGVLAVVLDAAMLSFDDAPRQRSKSYALTPWADPRGDAGLQLMATF